jgi:hypothetical protein
MQTKRRLTRAVVRSLRPGVKRYEAMCAALPGFGVRVGPISRRNPAGTKVFFVRYRIGGGRRGSARWMRLGPFDDHYTVDRARKDAQRVLQLAREGRDPAGTRADARSAPTVDELCDRYLAEHAVPPNKKPSSIRMDRSNIKNHVRKALGPKKVAAVKKADVEALKRKMSSTPGAANRVLALVSRMMTLAEEWELRPVGSNPCRGVKRYPERQRQRFLTGDERQRLEAVLAAAEGNVRRQKGYVSQGAIDEFRLLAMTARAWGRSRDFSGPWSTSSTGACVSPKRKRGTTRFLNPASLAPSATFS